METNKIIVGYEKELSKEALANIRAAMNDAAINEIIKKLMEQDKRCEKLRLVSYTEIRGLLSYCSTYEQCKIIFKNYIDNIESLEGMLNS